MTQGTHGELRGLREGLREGLRGTQGRTQELRELRPLILENSGGNSGGTSPRFLLHHPNLFSVVVVTLFYRGNQSTPVIISPTKEMSSSPFQSGASSPPDSPGENKRSQADGNTNSRYCFPGLRAVTAQGGEVGDREGLKNHYQTEWHLHNLKRKAYWAHLAHALTALHPGSGTPPPHARAIRSPASTRPSQVRHLPPLVCGPKLSVVDVAARPRRNQWVKRPKNWHDSRRGKP